MTYEEISKRRKQGEKVVFVFGAGMEMTSPINLPSSKNLPIEILTELFVDADKNIETCTKFIKEASGCPYNFESLIYSRIKDIFQDSNSFGINELENSKGTSSVFFPFIKAFRDEINAYKSGSSSALQDAYEHVKPALFGKDGEGFDLSCILDANKLSLNVNCTKVIELILKEYIRLKKANSPDSKADRECLSELFQGIVNYDSLLTENYIGYYKNTKAAQNRYLYLSWLLWLFLMVKERKVEGEENIYNAVVEKMNPEDHIITMNYTTFVNKALKDDSRITHFHGDISGYIRDRKEKEIPNYRVDGFDDIMKGILWTGSKDYSALPIPRMMPPLDIKPLISYEYLDRWMAAKNQINSADWIIVVGYSFAKADSHFNDMIFNAEKAPRIIIIDTGLTEKKKDEMHKSFGEERWSKVETDNLTRAEDFFGYTKKA